MLRKRVLGPQVEARFCFRGKFALVSHQNLSRSSVSVLNCEIRTSMDGTEVVVASSPVDAGISCWHLQSGAEHLRHRSCASPPHGLVCVADRFFASSQLRDSSSSSSSSGSIFYWSWSKVFVSSLFLPSKPTPKVVFCLLLLPVSFSFHDTSSASFFRLYSHRWKLRAFLLNQSSR